MTISVGRGRDPVALPRVQAQMLTDPVALSTLQQTLRGLLDDAVTAEPVPVPDTHRLTPCCRTLFCRNVMRAHLVCRNGIPCIIPCNNTGDRNVAQFVSAYDTVAVVDVPKPAEIRQILGTLIGDWHATPPSVRIVPRESIAIGVTVFGLTAHVYALAEGVMSLYDADQDLAAVPLVREAIECAVTAVWVDLAGYAGAHALLYEQTKSRRNALKAYVDMGMPSQDDVTQLDAELAASLKTNTGARQNFEQRCREIEGGPWMYALYRAASQVSHATMSVVEMYMGEAGIDDDAPHGLGLALRPAAYSPDAWLRYLLVAVVQATSPWSRLDKAHTHRTVMKALNTRLGTRYRQQFTAEGLKNQRVRENELREWKAQPKAI